jgi:catechol 2,3-dioxygenase-like lactoylglutathione lyase family enzyme
MSEVIDHISLGVADLERSRRFYDAVAGSLGFSRLYDTATGSVYGLGKGSDDFGIIQHGAGMPSAGSHVALRARDRRAVDAFHAAALAAGARDDGAPGLRPQYHANYYAAFIIDPDGHRIEAVCHHGTAQS